jgi:methionyl-tRNA synthetase
MVYLAPVIPELADKTRDLLREDSWSWSSAQTPLLGREINKFKPLLTRVEPAQVEKMVEQSKDSGNAVESGNQESDEITIDDFSKVDLRVARIEKAESVEGADKLLRLTLSLGTETRTVFAGIKAAYDTDALQGRLVIAVANLQPRKMRFGMSEGMVLAAGPGGEEIFLLSADSGATPGMRVK